MIINSTLSADIVCSTKFSSSDTLRVKKYMEEFISSMRRVSPGSWGRVVKGDAMECVLEKAGDALRVALMLKCYMKAFEPELANTEFSKYGMRIAIGIGSLRTNDEKNGIIDGEAIYKSGRCIEEKRNLAKGTMFVEYDGRDAEVLNVLVSLCDVVVNKATGKQCKVLYHKLAGLDEVAVAELMDKKRPTINKHSMVAGWPAIEKAVSWFESIEDLK